MSNKDFLITIGISYYNSEKYLPFAIESILSQTYCYWELILVDDGSKDSSFQIANSYQKKDQRIKSLSDGTNLGFARRLNQLSDFAKGTFFCRMDADDIMHPERLESQLNYLISNPEIDLVSCGVIAINNDNAILGLRRINKKRKYSLKDTLSGAWCIHPSIMGKTSWFKRNKYDISLKRSQDYDLWIRTIDFSYFSMLEGVYLYYREASTSTVKKHLKALKHSTHIYRKNIQIIGLFTSIKLYVLRFAKLIMHFILGTIGKSDILINQRSLKISESLHAQHAKTINEIVLKAAKTLRKV